MNIRTPPSRPAATPVITTATQNHGVSGASPSPVTLGCIIAPAPDGSRRLISGAGTRCRSPLMRAACDDSTAHKTNLPVGSASAQRMRQGLQGVGHDCVVGPLAPLLACHQAGVDENLHVVRDRGLRE